MPTHLENLEKTLVFVLSKTPTQDMINDLFGNIKSMVERQMLLRDAENFTALFKFAISSLYKTKGIKIGPEMIQTFIDRTSSEPTDIAHELRADRLYTYLNATLKEKVDINNANIECLEKVLKKEKKPSFEKLMTNVRIAMILKWLQGPLQSQLSNILKDHVIFYAALYGQYRTNRMFNVDWYPYEIPQRDEDLIIREYKYFEKAIKQAVQEIGVSLAERPHSDNYYEQFRVVFESLDNLNKMSKKKNLGISNAFKDKIIVSTALIYLQDEFVAKGSELKHLIQLFISLYYQYSDKHYYLDVLQKK